MLLFMSCVDGWIVALVVSGCVGLVRSWCASMVWWGERVAHRVVGGLSVACECVAWFRGLVVESVRSWCVLLVRSMSWWCQGVRLMISWCVLPVWRLSWRCDGVC